MISTIIFCNQMCDGTGMPPKIIISPRRADGDVQELEQAWEPNPGYGPTPK